MIHVPYFCFFVLSEREGAKRCAYSYKLVVIFVPVLQQTTGMDVRMYLRVDARDK